MTESEALSNDGMRGPRDEALWRTLRELDLFHQQPRRRRLRAEVSEDAQVAA